MDEFAEAASYVTISKSLLLDAAARPTVLNILIQDFEKRFDALLDNPPKERYGVGHSHLLESSGINAFSFVDFDPEVTDEHEIFKISLPVNLDALEDNRIPKNAYIDYMAKKIKAMVEAYWAGVDAANDR